MNAALGRLDSVMQAAMDSIGVPGMAVSIQAPGDDSLRLPGSPRR
jgi:hypothetical protein